MTKRILIVEDDTAIARVVQDNLAFDGFEVECQANGREALVHARRFKPDLVLLDLMLPGIDGLEICRALNQATERTPVIIITARTQKDDRVLGLELGADDYVTKPFALDELLARVHAVLRRTQPHPANLKLGEITFDFQRMSATRGGKPLSLTDRELAVIRRLAERVGHVVSRDELLRIVWGYVDTPVTRTVDNLIVRLRRKIEPDPKQPRFIRTAHGDGYRLTPDG
jgi:two-component system, OmpR family, alkaline phosphatase synthesis response regulator PhoP